MRITHISDTHGVYEFDNIHDCDVLCITGDWSPLRIQCDDEDMKRWITGVFIPVLCRVPARRVVLIGGNHDFITERPWFRDWFNAALKDAGSEDRIRYLCNDSVTIDGVRFYGCPCSDIEGWAWYSQHDPHRYEPERDTTVMLVHQAPRHGGLGETVLRGRIRDFGSTVLLDGIGYETPDLLLCGHIHGGSHVPALYSTQYGDCVVVNGSVLDEDYEVKYPPHTIGYEKDATLTRHVTVDERYEFTL